MSSLEGQFLVGFLVGRRAGNHPEISQLFEIDRAACGADALLRSGPAVTLTKEETAALSDPAWSCCCVAASLETRRIIGYVSAHKVVTRARGAKAQMEEAVVSPLMCGKGVGKAMMVALMDHVRDVWKVRRAVLTSDPSRETARALYAKLGFVQKGDQNFSLQFPSSGSWLPSGCNRPRYCCGVDREPGGAFWHMTDKMRRAVSDICSGDESAGWGSEPWTIINPVGIYYYKDAP